MRRAPSMGLILILVSLGGWRVSEVKTTSQQSNLRALSEQERVAKNKQTLLTRLKRSEVSYRGDPPGVRVRSEWVDEVVSNYVYQKLFVAAELSAGEKYDLRPLGFSKI